MPDTRSNRPRGRAHAGDASRARRVTNLLLAAVLCAALTGTATLRAAASPSRHDARLRVLTYNIRHGEGIDGRFDLSRTAAAIRAQHPDVVGLQEVDDRWGDRSDYRDEPRALARMLHMHAYFAAIYDLPPLTDGAADRRYGLAILSRYPLRQAKDHQITRMSTQVANATPVPGPGFPEVTVDIGGRPVHVYDTHLDYRSDPAVRRTEVGETLSWLEHDRNPSILVGDFNAGPTASELAPLFAQERDVWKLLGRTDPPTFPADAPTGTSDYITVSNGIHVASARVADTRASDHRPVVADLTLER